ncbi:MAG: tail fiber domain-containing protein [Ferruginibacter sp.]|nr:tail fiber domain-containing protein [Bacteroidota bacterium]MBX2918816.1 tail fiber domain-containing protein [Ferruginibacter sp.]MCC7379553.1 tail fiber domain-containing protein [Chitinophagaceae bacterium]
MKKLLPLFLFLLVAGMSRSQNVGIGTTTPDASAQLDISSTTSGLLAPRMTKAQRDAIATPATGLLIYQTNNTAGFYYYDGSTWKMITSGGKAWLLNGNNNTDPATNFIGTADDQPLNFRVNNSRAGYLSSNGNVFWGKGSGQNTTIGKHNAAIGSGALNQNTYGDFLVAIGDSALFTNEGLTYNTAVGTKALFSTLGGYYNTAVGFKSLFANSDGYANSAFGNFSLSSNISGFFNVAIGSQSLNYNTNGNYNVALGNQSLYNNTTGKNNTSSGAFSLYKNTIGENNTANGYQALFNNTTGSGNTAIGYRADVSAGNLTNATAIGYNATVNASNKIRLGNSSVNVIEGQVAYSFPSDARFKYNIKDNVPGLDFITKLKPVTYYFDTKKLDAYTKTGVIDNSNIHPVNYTGAEELHTGFLAQDVEKIAEELGYYFDGIHKPANDRDHYSLAYSQFIMPLVKAVQEQQEMITQQKQKNMEQQEMNKQMEKAILSMQEEIRALKEKK